MAYTKRADSGRYGRAKAALLGLNGDWFYGFLIPRPPKKQILRSPARFHNCEKKPDAVISRHERQRPKQPGGHVGRRLARLIRKLG
jgi:hypothetical protein